MGYTLLIDESGAFPRPGGQAPHLGILAASLSPTKHLTDTVSRVRQVKRKHGLSEDVEVKASHLQSWLRGHEEGAYLGEIQDPEDLFTGIVGTIAETPSTTIFATYCDTDHVHEYLENHPWISTTPACAGLAPRTYRMAYQNLLQRAAKEMEAIDATVARVIVDHSQILDTHYQRAGGTEGYMKNVPWLEEWHDLLVRREGSHGQPLHRICDEVTVWPSSRSPALQLADFVANAFYAWLREVLPAHYRPLAPLVRRHNGKLGQIGLICMPPKDRARLPEEKLQAIMSAAGGPKVAFN